MRLLRLIGLLMAWVLAGCGSAPAVTPTELPPPDQRPEDFVLAVTVLSPPSAHAPAARAADSMDADADEREERREDRAVPNLPRSLRPARYIVEADGVLRVSIGAGASTTTFPSQTRQLTPRQLDALWRQLRATNLLAQGNAARIEGPEEAKRAPDRTTALIYASFDGRRVQLRLLLDRGSDDAVAAERLVDRLAELAWIRD